MSRGINKVILVGNLGDDPETKFTQGGTAVTKARLATTSIRKDRDGNPVERTEWHRITFFGKLGEIAGEYLRKGSQVYVEGSIRYDKYEKDDIERYTTDIIADEMQMLGGKPEGGANRAPATNRDRPSRNPAPSKPYDPFEDDEHPAVTPTAPCRRRAGTREP